MTVTARHVRPRTPHGVFQPFRSLLTAQAIGAALGLVFWILAARLVPAHDVGVAAAAISLQTLLGTLTSLGLGTMLISELPLHEPSRQRRLIMRSLLAVAVSGGLIGAVAAFVGGRLNGNLHEALGNWSGALVFMVGVIAAAMAIVVDDSCLGVRRSGVQVGRNLFASSLRFPVTAALLALGLTDSHVLQLCWVLPLLLSVPSAMRWLRLPRLELDRPRLRVDLATYVAPALRNHALNLSLAAGTQLVPVIAGITLGGGDNAEFTIAWLIASFVFLPPYLLAIALFAHGANVSTEEFRSTMQTTIPASLGLSLLLCIGAWTLGEPVLHIFGGRYASHSYVILAALVPAGLWMVFKDHLVALLRSQRRFGVATRLAATAAVMELAGASVGAVLHGTVGLCVGWLVAMVAEISMATPWLREAFGGLHYAMPWQLPARLSKTAKGAVRLEVVGAVALLLTLAAAAVVAVVAMHSDKNPTVSGDPPTAHVACLPTPTRSGPLVDLGVQASTGQSKHPLLSPAKVGQIVGLAKQAGASVISTSANWSVLQPEQNQPYDWTGLDEVVQAATDAGLQVRVQLVGMPAWAQDQQNGSDYKPPLSPAELQRWAQFVKDITIHLRQKVDYMEVWNEPNDPTYWSTGPDPAAFVRLLAVTDRVIHRYNPIVKVISGGLDGNDIGYLQHVYAAIKQQGISPSPFDLVGVHPYSGDLAPGAVLAGRSYQAKFGVYDQNFTGFRGLHDVMVANGDTKMSMYIGEFGYSTKAHDTVAGVPDATRAGYLIDAFRAATCSPYIAALSWYYLFPTPYDPPSWTLLDKGLMPSDTFRALQKWNSYVVDATS